MTRPRHLVLLAAVSIGAAACSDDRADGPPPTSVDGSTVPQSTDAAPATAAPATGATAAPDTAADDTSAVPLRGVYEPVSMASLDHPNPTDEIRAEWVQPDGRLSGVADGVYHAWRATVVDGRVVFELDRIWTGDACRAEFGTSDEACASDNSGYSDDPVGTMAMPEDVADVIVCNANDQRDCYRVDAQELRTLLESDGQVSSAEAPPNFDFGNWTWWVIVRDSEIVGAHSRFIS